MTIETKLDIGQTAFILFNNQIFEVVIEEINTKTEEEYSEVVYSIEGNPAGSMYAVRFNENDLYESKESLLASL